MKTLLISTYDMECNFTTVVLNDGVVIEAFEESKELSKYNLYDNEDHWFTPKFINKFNTRLREFDNIILCEDGEIDIYYKNKDY